VTRALDVVRADGTNCAVLTRFASPQTPITEVNPIEDRGAPALAARLREEEGAMVVMVDVLEREVLMQEDPKSWRRKAPKRLLVAYDEAAE
jgi:hypothetical protein